MNNNSIVHENINCGSCKRYEECKSIEEKHKDQLEELGGNWRAVFEGKARVGTPTRRCSGAMLDKHLDSFKNSKVLEIGCGPLSPISLDF